jgi:hypothetical protein
MAHHPSDPVSPTVAKIGSSHSPTAHEKAKRPLSPLIARPPDEPRPFVENPLVWGVHFIAQERSEQIAFVAHNEDSDRYEITRPASAGRVQVHTSLRKGVVTRPAMIAKKRVFTLNISLGNARQYKFSSSKRLRRRRLCQELNRNTIKLQSWLSSISANQILRVFKSPIAADLFLRAT